MRRQPCAPSFDSDETEWSEFGLSCPHTFLSQQDDPEAPIHRLPGHRVRRFFMERTGRQGTLHFMDGTATTVVFDMDHDDGRVLHFFGLTGLEDGDRSWFDLAATPVESGWGSEKTLARFATLQP